MRFMNGWRPILQMMLFIHCKKKGLAVEKYVSSLVKGCPQEQIDIILDLFNLKSNVHKYLYNLSDPMAFVKREKHGEEIVDTILDILIDFILEVIDDREEQQDKHVDSSITDSQYSSYHNKKGGTGGGGSTESQINYTPLILIFDTVYLLDEPSWKLLELVKEECKKIAIIMLVQTDTGGQPKIHSEATQFYQEVFGSNQGSIKIMDLPPFKSYDLEELLIELSPQYQQQMLEEINLQIQIDDPKTSIKNAEQCKIKERELKTKHLVAATFSRVS